MKKYNLLYVGRIVHEKGLDILIEALAAVAKSKSFEWHLRVVGDGDQKSECVDLAQKLGIAEYISFLPWKEKQDLKEDYEWADVFVHPARWAEPFGRTIVEAMSFGLPVVVPREGGTAWAAGDAGIQFENGNKLSLQGALEYLLCDPHNYISMNENEYSSMGEAGKKRAQKFAKNGRQAKWVQLKTLRKFYRRIRFAYHWIFGKDFFETYNKLKSEDIDIM